MSSRVAATDSSRHWSSRLNDGSAPSAASLARPATCPTTSRTVQAGQAGTTRSCATVSAVAARICSWSWVYAVPRSSGPAELLIAASWHGRGRLSVASVTPFGLRYSEASPTRRGVPDADHADPEDLDGRRARRVGRRHHPHPQPDAALRLGCLRGCA